MENKEPFEPSKAIESIHKLSDNLHTCCYICGKIIEKKEDQIVGRFTNDQINDLVGIFKPCHRGCWNTAVSEYGVDTRLF